MEGVGFRVLGLGFRGFYGGFRGVGFRGVYRGSMKGTSKVLEGFMMRVRVL